MEGQRAVRGRDVVGIFLVALAIGHLALGAYQLIDPRMMNWLLSTGGAFGFEVVGPNLLVYSHRRRPTELIPLFGSAQLFRDHIPRLVRTEYGIRQGEGTDPTERSSS